MNKLIALACLILAVFGSPAYAQDITGQWQGTLHAGVQDLRTILVVSKESGGALKADLYSIDQGIDPIPVDTLTLTGSTVKYAVKRINGSYEGVLSADGHTLKGAWTQTKVSPLELVKATKASAWAIDPSPHKVSFVATSDHVKLEVLDWGGTGRPLVFIPGLGATAHVFDKFALQLTGKYHVYGVTRRGYGASDKPDPAMGANYTADRLGDDVVTAIDALKLDRPVLAGWSLGGEEMSSIGSRLPEKVSGLIYLDAGYAYSFYAPGNLVPIGSNLLIDANDLRAKIIRTQAPGGVAPAEASAAIDKLLAVDVPQLQADLTAMQALLKEVATAAPAPVGQQAPGTLQSRIGAAIMAGEQKYADLKPPILAIFAFPHAVPPGTPETMRANFERQEAVTAAQLKRFEDGNPKAKVVRLANAQHAVFISNPADVLREMTAFIDGLK